MNLSQHVIHTGQSSRGQPLRHSAAPRDHKPEPLIYLTDTERAVLQALADGLTKADAARAARIPVGRIPMVLSAACAAFGVESAVHAVAEAVRKEIIY